MTHGLAALIFTFRSMKISASVTSIDGSCYFGLLLTFFEQLLAILVVGRVNSDNLNYNSNTSKIDFLRFHHFSLWALWISLNSAANLLNVVAVVTPNTSRVPFSLVLTLHGMVDASLLKPDWSNNVVCLHSLLVRLDDSNTFSWSLTET